MINLAYPFKRIFLFVSFFVFMLIVFVFSLSNLALAAPVRGTSGDAWAELVIGQPSFEETTPFTTVSNKLFMPHGAVVDTHNPADQKLYIYDAGNSRILGYDLEDCRSSIDDPLNCEPDIVIGQPDFISSFCNGDSGYQNYPDLNSASASSLCGISEKEKSIYESESGSSMDVDSEGSLYITDILNNRILKYNDPFNTDSIADDVWGQDNFTDIFCNKGAANPDATTFCFSDNNLTNGISGVDIDSSGNMWVADHENNRVLRFPNEEGIISKTADLVLGQASFTTNNSGSNLNELSAPASVRVNSSDVIYVADRENHRVLKYVSPSSGGAGVNFGSSFSHPSGLDFDSTQPGKIWISNSGHCAIELWDETGETEDRVLGAEDDCNINGDPFGSVGVDVSGNVYVTTGTGALNNTVLIYDSAGPYNYPTDILYEESGTGNLTDENSLGAGQGVVVTDDQLIVADKGRIMFWNTPSGISSLTTGKAADGVAWVSDFSSLDFSCCHVMQRDDIGNLYVAATNEPTVYVFQLPLSNGDTPYHTITMPIAVLGGGQIEQLVGGEQLTGLIPTSDSSFLWITQRDGHRVLRIRHPLPGDTPTVDVILGQEDLSGTSCNQGGSETDSTLCYPGVLGVDKNNNFYIADNSNEGAGNERLLMYYASTLPTDNTDVIYATVPDKIFEDFGASSLGFDSLNRMANGFDVNFGPQPNPNGGWFVGITSDPDGADTEPDFYLNDYSSVVTSIAFDSSDNLYVADASRSRILIYENPQDDSTVPVLTEVTPVSQPTTDTTPSYTLNTTQAGTLHYEGPCESVTSNVAAGDVTLNFNQLETGTYTGCSITLVNNLDIESDPLIVTSFIIDSVTDTTAPNLAELAPPASSSSDFTPNYNFNSSEAGTITYGGSCVDSGRSTSSIKIYKDSTRVDSEDIIGGSFIGPSADSIEFEIGAQNGGSNGWSGKLDELKAYNYGRSKDHIQEYENNLVGYWKMDEGSWVNDCSSETVIDSSQNLNNGKSCPNGDGPTGGSVGHSEGAGSFDGSDDVIDLGDNKIYDMRTNDWTISAWTKTSVSDGFIVAKANSTPFYAMRMVGGKLNGLMHDGSDGREVTGTISINDSEWHHVAVVWNRNGNMELYVDGVADGSIDISDWESVDIINDTNLSIGANCDPGCGGPGNFFLGEIDEVKIYNTNLDLASIKNLYYFTPNVVTHLDTTPAVSFWNLNEGSGSNAQDIGTGGLDGTLISSPTWESGTSCIFGNCLSFGGSSYIAAVPFSGSSTGVTYDVWINPTDLSGADIIASQYDSSNAYMQLYTEDSSLVFVMQDNKDSDYIGKRAAGVVASDSWQHFTAVWDAGRIASSGSNYITFDSMSEGTYEDCTITVTDAAGNVSNPLSVSTFTLDSTSPVIAEVTPVTTPTTDTTPSYEFNSSENGLASYGGTCSSSDTSVSSGDNTITFDTLAVGTYSDCTITVVDSVNNESNVLSITPFTIQASDDDSDITAPTTPGTPDTNSPTQDATPKWTWSSSTDFSGIDHYEITWCKDIDFDGCDGNTGTVSGTSFTHGSELSNNTWYAKVRAYDPFDNVSNWSELGKVKIDTKDPEIDDADVSVTTTKIKFSINTNEKTSYKAEIGTTEDYGNEKSDSERMEDRDITFNDLQPGTKYYIKITVKDEAGNSTSYEYSYTTAATPVENYIQNSVTSLTTPEEKSTNIDNTNLEDSTSGPRNDSTNSETKEIIYPKIKEKNIIEKLEPLLSSAKENLEKASEKPVIQITAATVATIPLFSFLYLLVYALSPIMPFISLSQFPGLLAGLIRKRRFPWGVVYDSKTKQPLDPVVLTLKDSLGKEIAQTVTDLYGRYEFLVTSGKYYLTVQKMDYTFPSKNYTGLKTDEVYENIYLGEEINLNAGGKISFNIPMDSTSVNFNETTKEKLYGIKGVSSSNKVLLQLSFLLFKIGFIYSFFVALLSIWNFNLINLIIFLLYLIIGLYRLYKSKAKSWGIIQDKYNNPLSSAVVKLINTKIPQLKIPPVVTDKTGRYVYLMDKGTYQLQIETKDTVQNLYTNKYTSSPIQIDENSGYIAQDVVVK